MNGSTGAPGVRSRRGLAWAAVLALTAIWLLAASRVYVNASWSDDAWGYFVLPMGLAGTSELRLGDRVVFDPPAALGATMAYLKTVRGLPGAQVRVDGDRWILVDGRRLGRAKPFALDGRPLEAVAGGVIPPDHYYLHADHPDSHDSRYAEIGPVPRERVIGRAVALPDLPWLGLQGPLAGPAGPGSSTREPRP